MGWAQLKFVPMKLSLPLYQCSPQSVHRLQFSSSETLHTNMTHEVTVSSSALHILLSGVFLTLLVILIGASSISPSSGSTSFGWLGVETTTAGVAAVLSLSEGWMARGLAEGWLAEGWLVGDWLTGGWLAGGWLIGGWLAGGWLTGG